MVSACTAHTVVFYIFMAPLALGESAISLAALLSLRLLSSAFIFIAIAVSYSNL